MAAESHRKLKFLWIVACVAVVAILCFLYVNPGPVKHIDQVKPAGWSHGAEHGAGATTSNTTSNTDTFGSTTNHSYGYLLPVYIDQQSSGALSGYGDLASLAGYLNLSAVEPYVVGNTFLGVPTIKYKDRALTLSTLYDFEDLHNTIGSCFNKKKGVLEMSTFEQFLTKTSSAVIYAHIRLNFGNYESAFSDGKRGIVEIDRNDGSAKNNVNKLNNWAAYVSKEHNLRSVKFKVKKVFVIDVRPKVPLKLTTIQDVLGSAIRKQFSMNGSVTVLFGSWRAIHPKPDTSYFYYVPNFYKPCEHLYNTNNSQTVIKASQAFSRHLKDSETAPRIGVHIRAERLFLKLKGNFVKCLQKLDNTIKIVMKNFKTTPQVRVIHDLGKYGTTGCKDNYCIKFKLKFFSELKRLNLEAVYYEPDDNPSFPRTSMFAAFVEREYLSTSDVLVTVGFGGFQMILVEQFLHRSIKNKEHLHRICL